MITRPSTSEVLNGIRSELIETVLPEVTNESTRVTVQMLENVLKMLAVRAEHEISWMHEEVDAIEATVGELVNRLDDNGIRGAMAALTATKQDSGGLELSDVSRVYSAAGELLSVALETALGSDDTEAVARLRQLVKDRSAHEMAIVGEYIAVGRV